MQENREVGSAPGQIATDLRAQMGGEVLCAGDTGYEGARQVWNGMIDRKPALIARPRNAADVQAAVACARRHNLLLAVRGGGHNVAGTAVCNGGLMLDLSGLNDVQVDPQARTVRAQAGVTWGELDQETAAHDLATTGGLVSTTGIAGFTLGGGLGWLMRRFGLACDNLLEAEVVTADGRLLTADSAQNADLFWGLRGGGGNFGVVTSFVYRLYPLSMVLGGLVAYPLADARRVLAFYRDFALTAPDALTVHAGLLQLPEVGPVVALLVCYSGNAVEGDKAVRPLRTLGRPVVDTMSLMPYTVLQRAYDAGSPPGLRNYWKSSFLRVLSDEAIGVLVERFPSAPSERSNVLVERIGGAVARVPRESTAFPHRDAEFDLLIASVWDSATDDAANIGWARDLFSGMRPHMGEMVYVNYLGDEGEDRVRAAYGPGDYDRLVALKSRFDPTNLFRGNQNIRPTGAPSSAGS